MKKQTTLIIFIAFFAIPNLAFASWWNPFSWSWFKKSVEVKPVEIITFTETKTSNVESAGASSTVETKIKVTESVPLRRTDTPALSEVKPAAPSCDQECLERRAINKRNEEEARRLDAIMLENQKRAAEQENSEPPTVPVYSSWRTGVKQNTTSIPTPNTTYSDSECLAQKQSYISEVDSVYLNWYTQWQEARKAIDSCYASNTVPYCDKQMETVNVEWQSKITATMRLYQNKLTQCAPEKRMYSDISKVVSSPY